MKTEKKVVKRYLHSNKFGLLAIIITWYIFFFRTITGKKFYFLDDLKAIYYPLENIYAQFQHGWSLPVWSNLFGFGHPLLAWGQLGFFTPLHVLLRALYLHPIILLQISIVVYFGIGILGMYVFLKHHRLSVSAASLGAIVYTFSGFNVGHLNHVNFYVGTMILPWLWLAVTIFISYPTIKRAIIISIIGAIIALSAHPQVIIYIYVATIIYAVVLFFHTVKLAKSRLLYLIKIIIFSLLAAVIAFGLSSFAILPFYEFMPLTDRAGGLGDIELFEFSYPPYHAITLIAPYLFGDHNIYWGAKNFQELAGYTGILPLLLAVIALITGHQHKSLQLTALALVILGIIYGLGQYSFIYTYLVEQGKITLLSIPGRLIMFIDLAIAVLAAIGLDALLKFREGSKNHKYFALISIIGILSLVTVPLVWYLSSDQIAAARIKHLLLKPDLSIILALVSLVIFLSIAFLRHRRITNYVKPLLLFITAGSLIYLGWNYNPLVDRATALTVSPFTQILSQNTSPIPNRLYSRPRLLQTIEDSYPKPTDKISAAHSVYQPVTVDNNQPCFTVPMFADGLNSSSINVSLKKLIKGPAQASMSVTSYDISIRSEQYLCFRLPVGVKLGSYYLAFENNEPSTINLYYQRTTETKSVYFVRVSNPTDLQIIKSHKLGALIYAQDSYLKQDNDVLLMERHLQTTANTSSARWIAAASIKTYRDSLEYFLANDQNPIDDAGNHVLTKNRKFFDLFGVTHLAQIISSKSADAMEEAGFNIIGEYANGFDKIYLYENLVAYPKAFMVAQAIFAPADEETRKIMARDDFQPDKMVIISSSNNKYPAELPKASDNPLDSSITITEYNNTRVDIDVNTNDGGWLVLTDSQTPQWHTFIDGQPAPSYLAYTAFRAAQVPAGKHTVSFRYYSRAVEQAKKISIVASIIALILLFFPYQRISKKHRQSFSPSP